MSKEYNIYARRLDEAFRAARDDYKNAYDRLQAAERKRGNGVVGSPQRQRAELDYQDAQREFKSAEKRIWGEFNQLRSDLRRELVEVVDEAQTVNPDAVDENGLELLKSGIMTAKDFYTMEKKYDGNPTMLRLLAKYAQETADNSDHESTERGGLYMLAERCKDGQGAVIRDWDALSKIADYCSGQAHGKPGSPTYILSMGQQWEQLSSEAVENF